MFYSIDFHQTSTVEIMNYLSQAFRDKACGKLVNDFKTLARVNQHGLRGF